MHDKVLHFIARHIFYQKHFEQQNRSTISYGRWEGFESFFWRNDFDEVVDEAMLVGNKMVTAHSARIEQHQSRWKRATTANRVIFMNIFKRNRNPNNGPAASSRPAHICNPLLRVGYGQFVNSTDRRMHSIEFIVRLTHYAPICDTHQLIVMQFIRSSRTHRQLTGNIRKIVHCLFL